MNKIKLILFAIICIALAVSTADLQAQGAKSKQENSRYGNEEKEGSENNNFITEDNIQTSKENPPEAGTDEALIFEATNGEFNALEGTYEVDGCPPEGATYIAELKDLNNDGQPEVVVELTSGCMGGMTGRYSYIYVKNNQNEWKLNLEDIGSPGFLKTKNKGYPDVIFLKAGHHHNVYRWDGSNYKFYRMEDRN